MCVENEKSKRNHDAPYPTDFLIIFWYSSIASHCCLSVTVNISHISMYGDMETRMENAGRGALNTNVASRLDTVYLKSD